MTEFIFYSLLAIGFWFSQKVTDGHHEHGLDFFYGAKYFFGVLAGICAFMIMTYSDNPVIVATYGSLLFYWFWLQKVDNNGHMITAFFMLFAMLLTKDIFPFIDVILLFLAYVSFNYLRKNTRFQIFHILFIYKLHFLIIPLIYAIIRYDTYWFSIVFCNLLGTYIANRMFHLKRGI